MKKLLLISFLLVTAAGCNQEGLPVRDTEVSQDTVSQPPPNQMTVKVATIKLDDNGKLGPKIGCNDSVVLTPVTIPYTTQPLHAAFQELFKLGEQKDAYNAIQLMQKQPDQAKRLSFNTATIDNSGLAKIYLKGEMTGLGGVCNPPRVQAQIEQTALQFPTVKSVETYLNNIKVDWKTFGSER